MKKRVLSLFIIIAMIATATPAINAEKKMNDDKVTLIVEVKGDAALETAEAVLMGASEYNDTDASIQQTEKILSVQESVQEDIKNKVNKKAELGFTYTNVLNGFSVTVNKSDIDKIKALPNVENVYISGTHKRIEPVKPTEQAEDTGISLFSDENISPAPESTSGVENCCEMMNVPYMHELGYKGQGQAIVIIDSELDINHEMFAQSVENPKYTKADIAKMIYQKKLNAKAQPNQVWRNDKVPFTYDYGSNHADVFINNAYSIHGTLVSGVAAGKNGTLPNGNKFSSIAPEAQIIFMGTEDREKHNISDDAILAAVDDASKMDVAAINMSWGEDYQFWGTPLTVGIDKAINTAVNAGVLMIAAAGNSGDLEIKPSVADCSAAGHPASTSMATTVASTESDIYWDYSRDDSGKIKKDDNGNAIYEYVYSKKKGMDEYSSYGTNITLELKPEITTVGSNILCPLPGAYASSVENPKDEYSIDSGTSLAAPHMTGAAALMRQYIEENYQDKYENPAKFIENLTMTSAKILKKDDVPYSPRCQGAGLLDLQAATITPVILIGTEDKPKISLKDKLTDTFEIEFTAKNFTDGAVTYDTITPYVTIDNKVDSWGNIRNFYPSNLNFTTSDKPTTITVPANGETKISFTIHLDSTQTAQNLKTFINGFFIDGFVELSSSSNIVPTISIPYTGFYGDWTDAPALEEPYFSSGNSGNDLTSRATDYYSMQLIMGLNFVGTGNKSGKAYRAEDYAGISPNDDGNFDILYVSVKPQRTMADCNIRIENADCEIVRQTKNPNANIDKFTRNREAFDMTGAPDGDYTVYVTGHLAYEGAKDEEIRMRFYIDTVAPEITKKEIRTDTDEDGNSKTYLDLSMSDNRYVMGAMAEGKKDDGADFKNSMYTKAGKTGECSIEITGADLETLKVKAVDYAYNTTEVNVIEPTPTPTATPTIPPELSDRIDFARLGNVISAKLIFEKTTPPNENDIWLIVAYKKNGELKHVEIPSITDMTAGLVIPQKYKDCEIILYVWDKNMKPLMGVQRLDI